MAAPAPQNHANHRRYDPPWHFVGALIVAAGFVVALMHAVRHTDSYWNWWFVVYTLGIALCVFRARAQTLVVQNRVIRLEMRHRLKEVLAPALAARIGELSVSQLVGLRFASDAELSALVERCLQGDLANGEAVKKEIKNWQADWLRA
jgi:Family of unknown function (DUF6526)